MGLIRKILGPKSKYEKDLPDAYEARVSLTGGEEVTVTYLADTICGLVEHLDAEGLDPATVAIVERSPEREAVIARGLYTDANGRWLSRPELCRSFESHYPGHISPEDCSFSDRAKGIAER